MASLSWWNFSLPNPEPHHEEKSTRSQRSSAFLRNRAASLWRAALPPGYPAPSRAWSPCRISACSCSVMNVLSSVNSLSSPVPPPRPRLEKMGIPARLKASKSLWMVLTETEQCSASSFAVPHEPLMSKKTIWKRRSTCMEKLLKRSPPPQKLCDGPRRGIFQKARGLAWNSFPKGPLQ